MGNTLHTVPIQDKRFNNSALAQEVKKIMMNYTEFYRDSNVNTHLAKACCAGAVGEDIQKQNVISIAFPNAIDNCKDRRDGVCLETVYTGFQIKGNKENICNVKNIGIELNDKRKLTTNTSSNVYGQNSTCDNFMINHCAKSLYDQGCMKIDTNSVGSKVPRLATYKENKMCYNFPSNNLKENEEPSLSYGPPECDCINSVFGPSMNTWPAEDQLDGSYKKGENPYGLTSQDTDKNNLVTKYSLNIYKQSSTNQFPKALDKRCATRIIATDSTGGIARAFGLINDEKDVPITICSNQINISDSQINKATIADIKQENNCGGFTQQKPTKPEDSVESTTNPVTPQQIKERVEKIEEQNEQAKKQQQALQEAQDKARANQEAKEEALKAKAKADDIARLAKAKADDDARKAAEAIQEANRLRVIAEEAERNARIAIAKAKADADAKAKAEADALIAKAKMDAENAAKAKAKAELATLNAKLRADKLTKEQQAKRTRNLLIFGGAGISIIIFIIVLIIYFNMDTEEEEY
jgi:hypothetical protein